MDAKAAAGPERRAGPQHRAAPLFTGLVLLAAVVFVATHLADERRFVALVEQSEPGWLLVAALLQCFTYVCAAGVWHRALAWYRHGATLRSLIPLAIAKLFTDQAVPSAGMSGTLLVVRSLEGRGVARNFSIGAMLVGLQAYYAAYAVTVAAALAVLWRLGELTRTVLVLATLFALVAAGVPAGVLWLRERARKWLPAWVERLALARDALEALEQAPSGTLARHPTLAVQVVGLQIGVFVLDAATLYAVVRALGLTIPPSVALVSFVFASVVATLAWVPGGLGTFEGTCVAVLHGHGLGIEAALAATLLLRGLTFWLPMLPGLWLARREVTRVASDRPAAEAGDGT